MVMKLLQGIYYGRYEKWVHALLSFVIFISLGFYANIFLAYVITLSLGILKELYDKFFQHTAFDFNDILADIVGIIAGYSVYIILWLNYL